MAGRDILDFPLEEVEVPQAIVLMMVSATKCGGQADLEVDEDRLQLLVDKLESRVQDEIEKVSAVRVEPSEEDGNSFGEEPVDPGDLWTMDNGETFNYKGVVYQKACNALVAASEFSDSTYCCKRWGHNGLVHEDMDGNMV